MRAWIIKSKMGAAAKLVMILLFWFLIGLVWASFYDLIYDTLPTMYPIPVAQDSGTWNNLLWIWGLGCVIIALGGGLSLLSDGNINAIIGLNVMVLSAWLILLLIWIMLWVPINDTIPTALGAAPRANLSDWDNGFTFLMLGFALISIIGSGGISFGGTSRGRSRQKTQFEEKITIQYRDKPRYKAKYLYPRE